MQGCMCAQMRPSMWSHAPGLDSYAGPNVTAGIPTLATTHNSSTPSGCAACGSIQVAICVKWEDSVPCGDSVPALSPF